MLAQETVLQGRYRVIRQLGQGGMGAVYEALDERLDTTVALKETLFAEERLRKQFEREARLLARMHHPALPRVSDHFSEGEGQFLVMQYIAGEDLAKMMQDKQGPFPPDQVLTWGDQLLDALDYLHTQDPQIIHRDIKPQNLKLTSRGQIILLDFGLAKGQSGGVSVVTTSASIYGYTPNYAPLEQIQGLGTDARSDIYALSATLYHLMTAVKPPDALTRAAALVNGQPDPLVPANQISNFIGPEVASVLTRAMSQNRDQRYATAAGMRAALKGSGEVATMSGKAEAATMILEPSAATLAASSPASFTGSASQPVSRTGETTVVHSTSRKRSWAPLAIAAAVLLMVGVALGGYFAFQRARNSTVESPTVNSNQENVNFAAPATAGTSSEPSSGAVNDETHVDTPTQRVEPVVKKTESTVKEDDKTAKTTKQTQAPAPPRVPDPVQTNTPEEAFVPLIDNNNTGLLDRRRRLGGAAVRDLPDGSRIVVNPDGSRVLISPNGTRRVLRPGQRINRRNTTPYP